MDPDQAFDFPGHHGDALLGRLRPPDHFARRLADERRPIKGALPGHDEIRLGEGGVKAHATEYPLGPRYQPGPGQERETRPEPTRRPPARARPQLRPPTPPPQP